jgi:anaerobic ribonucleoside-triphosphate reductase activating protein
MTDGEGIRCALYVSGCPFRCEGCWNESIWSFRAGHPYTCELEDRILADLAQPYCQGLSLLGGEPMLATPVLLPLLRRVRAEFGDRKDVWCWTGFTWEELHAAAETVDKRELLDQVDVLVDGRFIEAQKDLMLQFRGSRNQRVIDVPRSHEHGRVVTWKELHDLERTVPEMYTKQRVAVEGRA